MPLPRPSASNPASTPRRYLIAGGTARYDHLPDGNLDSVPGDLQRIVGLFCGQYGYQRVLPQLGEGPTANHLRTALSEWLTDDGRRSDDIVVVYYSGHGETHAGRHYLLARDSHPRNLAGTALPTEELARMLGETVPIRHLLVMLDTCYAGRGAHDLVHVAAQLAELRPSAGTEPGGWWFVAAARPKDEAAEAVFTRAFTAAARSPRLGVSPEHVPLEEIVDKVNERFASDRLVQRARLAAADSSGVPPFIPNPAYRPGLPAGLDLETIRRLRQARQDAFTEHWEPRSRGVALASEVGSYFTGRTHVLRELVGWLADPDLDHRARVVTGGPGSGKSAVLARLVTLADPTTRQQTVLADAPRGTVPPEGGIDAIVHARNQLPADVLTTLAAELLGSSVATVEELIEALAARSRRRIVVLDALDEAADPTQLAANLLQPLIASAPRTGLRLLIGTRRPLIPALGPKVEIVDLDEPANLNLGDLADYVTRLLLAEGDPDQSTPYRDQPQLASTVAWAVACRASPTFLIARLSARALVSADHQVDTATADWIDRLPATVGQAFDAYLERFDVDEQRVRDLMLPLAFAEGGGLPWEQLWAPLASALSSDRYYTDDDLRWLQQAAGAYMVEGNEARRSVYRLYHQALAEHLRDRFPLIDAQQRITDALLTLVPAAADGRRTWQSAHPYIRTHLPTHAAEAGQLDNLVTDPDFVLAADPDRLLHALRKVTTEAGRRVADVYGTVFQRLRNKPLPERAAYLQLAARQRNYGALAEQLDELGTHQPWSVPWTRMEQAHPHLILGKHDGQVFYLAITQIDGRPLAVTGSDSVRVWDLLSNTQRAKLTGHARGIAAFTVLEMNDGPVVVTGDDHGFIRVWDLATNTLRAQLRGHPHGITAMAVTEIDGHAIAITGGYDDGTARVWDLATNTLRAELAGHVAEISAVAVAQVDGRPIAITGGDYRDGTVRVWDLTTHTQRAQLEPRRPSGRQRSRKARRPTAAEALPIKALTVSELDGCPILLVGHDSGVINVWDLTTATPHGAPLSHPGGGEVVMVAEVGGRPTVLTGGGIKPGTLRVWDLATSNLLAELRGHWGSVRAVAVTEVDGRPIALTSGMGNGVICVWDLAAYTLCGELLGHPGEVFGLGVAEVGGRPIAVTGGSDRTVRAWELSEIPSIDAATELDSDNTGWGLTLAAAEVDGRPIAVTSRDETVQLWDLAAQTLRAELAGHTDTIDAVAVAEVMGRPVALTGGGIINHIVRVWDLTTNTVFAELDAYMNCVEAVALIKVDGRPTVVTAGSYALRVWDLATNALRAELPGHPDRVQSVAVAELAGRPVAVTGGGGFNDDGIVRVWDLSRNAVWAELPGHSEGVRAVTTAEVDGHPTVITCDGAGDGIGHGFGNGIVRIWDIPSGRLRAELVGHSGGIQAVAVSSKTGYPMAITGGDDHTLRLWNLSTQTRVDAIDLGASISAIAVAPDGLILAATTAGLIAVRYHGR